MNRRIGMINAAATDATTMLTIRQPCVSANQASIGRKTSCPVAVLAVNTPTTRPRRLLNHRDATVLASTMPVTPVPLPTTMPQNSTSCHGSRISGVIATPNATRARAQAIVRRRAEALDHGGGERPDQPIQQDVDRNRKADRGARPAEFRLQWNDQHPGRGADPGSDKQPPGRCRP